MASRKEIFLDEIEKWLVEGLCAESLQFRLSARKLWKREIR